MYTFFMNFIYFIYIYIYMNEIHIDGMALYSYSRPCTHLELNRPFSLLRGGLVVSVYNK